MQIKVIYEDDAVLPIKKQIDQLPPQQFFFIEQYLQQKKLQHRQEIFQQWQTTLQQFVNHKRLL